ncbi:DUF4440 domain-containing protein [Marivirga sp. S37H4]|uniref:DUF4440 domain-containing protein n=1 Tax=Marivirga aurantiaca TaxID=2802615 RepID=A0A934X1R6_9BACT|nr:DUF4440 domain-containing protein [Marivirga aurantiaca]MBK6266720.1 DUF4440 domain-containing protein [Marivirga aurantiaca]
MEPLKNQKPRSPEDIPDTFVTAWNDRDTYELIDLFDESAELENVEGLWRHKNKEFFSAYDNGLKFNFKEVRLSVKNVSTKYITDTIAEVKAQLYLDSHPSAKNKIQRKDMVFNFVVQKSGDDWQCISLHTN